jgi:hypothetical protein
MLRATGAGHPRFRRMYAACPAWPGPTTWTDGSLSYPRIALREQVDGERHHLARADFGQQCRRNRDRPPRLYRVIHQQHRPVEAHPVAHARAGQYQLHPVDFVVAGGLLYPLSLAPRVLRFYDDFVKSAPDELSTATSLAVNPAGEPTLFIAVCYCGPIAAGEQVLHPLRTFQSPVEDAIQPMPYTVLQSARDEGFPSGRLHYWKSGWLGDLTDDAIEILMQFVPHMPSSASGVGIQQMHGVASRIAPSATAFPHRAEQYDFLILSQWSEAPDSDRNIAWTSALFHAMRPHLKESVYVNNLGDEGIRRVRAAYGENYSRLVALKRTFDPGNLFRANQNIDPTRL